MCGEGREGYVKGGSTIRRETFDYCRRLDWICITSAT